MVRGVEITIRWGVQRLLGVDLFFVRGVFCLFHNFIYNTKRFNISIHINLIKRLDISILEPFFFSGLLKRKNVTEKTSQYQGF